MQKDLDDWMDSWYSKPQLTLNCKLKSLLFLCMTVLVSCTS